MIRVTNRTCGICFAILFLALLLLIPYAVPATEGTWISSRLFPYLIGFVCLILSVLLVFSKEKKVYEIEFTPWIMIAVSALYYGLLHTLGFMLATMIASVLLSAVWGVRGKVKIAILSILTPVVFYIVFTLLMRINLPTGMLF